MSVKHVTQEQFAEITTLLDRARGMQEAMKRTPLSLADKLRTLETIKALRAEAMAIGS